MSWFGKWFKLEPVATQKDIDVLVNRLNQCESLIKLQERDIQSLKAKVQVLLDRPIAQQIHNPNPNTYVGNVRDVREPAAMVDVTDSSSSSSD